MPFKTIKGRFEAHRPALPPNLPKELEVQAILMFYAGFSACLDANLEIADLPERDAVMMLEALHREAEAFARTAAMIFAPEGKPS